MMRQHHYYRGTEQSQTTLDMVPLVHALHDQKSLNEDKQPFHSHVFTLDLKDVNLQTKISITSSF